MSDKEENKELEDLQKQLKDLLNSSQLQMGLLPRFSASEDPEDKEDMNNEEQDALNKITAFNLKPKEIRDYLNRFVVKQDEAKKVLSVAICDHYNHVRACIEHPEKLEKEYSKQNVLILGSTGVGKTYLMRTIAKLIGVPFVKADATKFSETGYMGNDVEDLVRDLVKAANGNTELAQYGIVYIDEIDKIASSTSDTNARDVSGRGVQINLLKLMEDTEVSLFSPSDIMSQMRSLMDFSGRKSKKAETINTRHILFIVSGAFDKLAEIVKKRINEAQVGFRAKPKDKGDTHKFLSKVATTDLIEYGFEPEFIGRLPVRVACESLQKDDLARILTTSEGSILNQYRDDFKGYDINFEITKEAIDKVAEQAAQEKTGARGLLTVLEDIFRPYKFELPSTAIKAFKVTADTLANPRDYLESLIQESKPLQDPILRDDIKRFVKTFNDNHGFVLVLDDEAQDYLIEQSKTVDRTIRAICEELFKDFEHGLQIISRNTHNTTFAIDKKTVMNPEQELSQWVVDSFKDIHDPSTSA